MRTRALYPTDATFRRCSVKRELKKNEPQPQKKKIKTKIAKETQSRVKCGSCNLDLINDTEEEGEMNIGCDQCIR